MSWHTSEVNLPRAGSVMLAGVDVGADESVPDPIRSGVGASSKRGEGSSAGPHQPEHVWNALRDRSIESSVAEGRRHTNILTFVYKSAFR